MGVVGCWRRFPGGAVAAPSLEVFRARLEQPGLGESVAEGLE